MKKNIFYLVLSILFVDCNPDIVILEPKVEFSYSISFDGFKVSFSNQSTNASIYNWDFGDGQTSTEHSPTHIYNSLGSFNVKLTVANENKSISTVKTIIIKDSLFNIKDTVSLFNKLISYDPGDNFDVDGDGIVDFTFLWFSSIGRVHSYEYSEITSFNGYEIFYDSIDVTTYHFENYPKYTETQTLKRFIPKIYIKGDKIINVDKTYNQRLALCYFYGQFLVDLTKNNIWIKDEVRYLGFRKIEGGKTKIGWFKLKVLDYTNITLYCFKIPHETDSLLIDN
jgi:PKD repeat protein